MTTSKPRERPIILYAKRDAESLGEHYTRHVAAMTAEGLHDKSDIAAELAWRDAEIERLRARLRARDMSVWSRAPD